MLKLTIELDAYGPLAKAPARRAIERIARTSQTLDQAAAAILKRMSAHGIGCYRGGSHLAIHPTHKGHFTSGSSRLAIITE